MGDGKVKEALESALEDRDSEKISSVLKKAFLNAIQLDIRTTLSEGDKKELHTEINLLEGDIKTTMHHDFALDPEKVAAFHQAQVNKAEQIIEKNVNTLKSLAGALIDLL